MVVVVVVVAVAAAERSGVRYSKWTKLIIVENPTSLAAPSARIRLPAAAPARSPGTSARDEGAFNSRALSSVCARTKPGAAATILATRSARYPVPTRPMPALGAVPSPFRRLTKNVF